MRTYPVMLPCHTCEDIRVATLTEYDNGHCALESHNADIVSIAEAIDIIRRHWPNAYLAEPVRDDTPPVKPVPTLGDLLNLAIQVQDEHCIDVDVDYNARWRTLLLDVRYPRHPADGVRNYRSYEIRLSDFSEATLDTVIQNAADWLNDLTRKYNAARVGE